MKSVDGFVYLTAGEMAEFDRVAIEDFGIDELLLMENAGAATARVARMMLGGMVGGRSVAFLIGKGNNGGDGLAAARHLHNWGARVTLILAEDKSELREIPRKQLAIVEKMGVIPQREEAGILGADLLVDAVFGYNLKGSPRGPAAGLIRHANSSGVRTLALDIPSGLDATSGEPGDPSIVAAATVTLGLPKVGFLAPVARRLVGDLYLADISFPKEVYSRFSQEVGIFGEDTLVRVW